MPQMREPRREIGTAVHQHDERPADGTATNRLHRIVKPALLRRQRLQHIGDVGRVHAVELGAQHGFALLVHQRFDQVLPRLVLALREVVDEALAAKQFLDLVQVFLQILQFLFRREGFDHGASFKYRGSHEA